LIKADEVATLQILDNLVSNALKYSQPTTVVEVTAAQENGWAIVMVKDQGPGLSEADQKMLFRKFTRLTAKPTHGESSNGLGLSIVKRLAEGMGGSIECRSVLGQGATFRLKLPRWEKEPAKKVETMVEVAK
jgi:signal transduction histidine kinase